MKFRPCIDLHDGMVKQIVGSTLVDDKPGSLKTNFTSEKPSTWYAELYRKDNLTGGHIIKLGPGNDQAAKEALAAWPGGMQVGGGINAGNAAGWIDYGASHVIVTSYVFSGGQIDYDNLAKLVKSVGKERLVLDLSCRKRDDKYFIVTDRWQKFTEVEVTEKVLNELAASCDEFLIHAADVEGKCSGIEAELVKMLAQWSPIAATYAGGIRNIADMQQINELGEGRVDLTIGSALDIFGGSSITYHEAVEYVISQNDS